MISPAIAAAREPLSLQQKVRRTGLVAGPLLAVVLYWALPTEYRGADGTVVAFGQAGRATLAAMAWMATWWMTEAVAIEVTALLPIALFPLAGIMPLGRTTANYGSEVIYLFFGGFVLALAIARWGLDRRIALMTLRLVGTRPKAVVAGDDGRDRVHQHVGLQHRHGGDDGSDRAVRRRRRAARPPGQVAGGTRRN